MKSNRKAKMFTRVISTLIVPTAFTYVLLGFATTISFAQGRATAVKELTEYVIQKFGKESIEEGTELFAKKMESVIVRYGDDGIAAIRKAGPRAVRLLEEAGESGTEIASMIVKHGDDALWVASKQGRVVLAREAGDDAVKSMIRHGEVAEQVLTKYASQSGAKSAASAATAMAKVTPQNARRLAMLVDDKIIPVAGRESDEFLQLMMRRGDQAMDFVWKNKAALAVGSVLVAFLANPDPFIDGTKDLAQITADGLVKPIATEIGKSTNWTIVILLAMVLVSLFFTRTTIYRWMTRKRPTRTAELH